MPSRSSDIIPLDFFLWGTWRTKCIRYLYRTFTPYVLHKKCDTRHVGAHTDWNWISTSCAACCPRGTQRSVLIKNFIPEDTKCSKPYNFNFSNLVDIMCCNRKYNLLTPRMLISQRTAFIWAPRSVSLAMWCRPDAGHNEILFSWKISTFFILYTYISRSRKLKLLWPLCYLFLCSWFLERCQF